ncbi:MAG: hypothetical protein V4438_00970 [Patescibacteria group bacterium]
MKNTSQLSEFLPLDKSWINRMGILDLRFRKATTVGFLKKQTDLPDDLKALLAASIAWRRGDLNIPVGESGTLLTFLSFLSWMPGGREAHFIRNRTLIERDLDGDPSIVNEPIEKLMQRRSKTSQWASAAVLCRNDEKVMENPPYRLGMTYEALEHWKKCYQEGVAWKPRADQTTLKQAECFLDILAGKKPSFEVLHSEDYCFGRVFRFITPDEGRQRFPSILNHESNRIQEVERALYQMRNYTPVTSDDHRVVEAVYMYATYRGHVITIQNPGCVSKGWPKFWEFMKYAEA